MPSRFVPWRIGYPSFFRKRVAQAKQMEMSLSRILSQFKISRGTYQRWKKNNFLERKSQKGGKKSRIPHHIRTALANIMEAIPDLMLSELQELFQEIHHVDMKIAQISRELQFLGFTRKLLTVCSSNANRIHQTNWWNNPPLGSTGIAGCLGVSTWHMVDIDECGIYYSTYNRRSDIQKEESEQSLIFQVK